MLLRPFLEASFAFVSSCTIYKRPFHRDVYSAKNNVDPYTASIILWNLQSTLPAITINEKQMCTSLNKLYSYYYICTTSTKHKNNVKHKLVYSICPIYDIIKFCKYLGFSDACDDKTAELALKEVDDQSIYFIATKKSSLTYGESNT
jgi:hypothetical protein